MNSFFKTKYGNEYSNNKLYDFFIDKISKKIRELNWEKKGKKPKFIDLTKESESLSIKSKKEKSENKNFTNFKTDKQNSFSIKNLQLNSLIKNIIENNFNENENYYLTDNLFNLNNKQIKKENDVFTFINNDNNNNLNLIIEKDDNSLFIGQKSNHNDWENNRKYGLEIKKYKIGNNNEEKYIITVGELNHSYSGDRIESEEFTLNDLKEKNILNLFNKNNQIKVKTLITNSLTKPLITKGSFWHCGKTYNMIER